MPTRPRPAHLIDALPDGNRALWATALYTGIRRGELRWSDIALDDNIISVSRTPHGARCSRFFPNQRAKLLTARSHS